MSERKRLIAMVNIGCCNSSSRRIAAVVIGISLVKGIIHDEFLCAPYAWAKVNRNEGCCFLVFVFVLLRLTLPVLMIPQSRNSL
jgi:hypothetical protein